MVSACKEFIGWKRRVSLGGHSEELAAVGKEGESERDSRHWKQHVQRCSGVAGESRGTQYGNVIEIMQERQTRTRSPKVGHAGE